MGERPDYELDIFSLLVDLVERPAGPSCDICLFTEILLGIHVIIIIFLCFILCSLKNMRIQYTPGTI